MSYLTIEDQDNIAVVTLDQPGESVNTLNEQLIQEFVSMLDKYETLPVDGIILISGKDNNFIAGADIEMLKAKKAPEEVEELSRRGNRLLTRLEQFNKPVVAAIHGSCLGGGNEVAMACHYRVASRDSKTVFGQPEVKIGLLPGGGGTQRLPRLIGIQHALTYILTGKNIYPRRAYKMGLVDELVHKDALLTAAKEAIAKINNHSFQRKDKRSLTTRLIEGNAVGRTLVFSQARKRTQKQTRGNYPAPFKIIEAIKEGYKSGMEAGLDKESTFFGQLAATTESKELVNLFFATQRAKKNPERDKARDIHKIGILGAGLMGSGIADVSVNNGYRVLLKDQNIDQAAQGEQLIWKNLEKKVKKHIITGFERDRISSMVTPTVTYDGFQNADLIIEAVFEDLDLKQSILTEVEQEVPDHCIFASNTSSLPISELAKASQQPGQVVGMHYFSPVQKMPLLEVIKTEQTADWVVATARQVGIQQGKHVITVQDGPGFYTTRILAPFMNEALTLLEEGVSIEDLDKYMKDFGFPVGPATLFDEVGIDVAAHITDVLAPLFRDRGVTTTNRPKELVDAGFKGRKNKTGFYTYENESKKKKEVNTDIYRFFGGKERSDSRRTEYIQLRMVLTMVNEAAWCLQNNILENPTDGDIGAVMGLGFPPFLGGPFRYIDRMGAGDVVSALEAFKKELGPRFTPAQILHDYASSGQKFYPN